MVINVRNLGSTIIELSIIFLIGILVLLILSGEIPKVLSEVYQTIAEESSANVAIQLASLMSASGAAPYRIEISYTPSSKTLYYVKGEERVLKVLAKFQQIFIQKMESTAKYCVPFENFEFDDVNEFLIRKTESEKKVFAWRRKE